MAFEVGYIVLEGLWKFSLGSHACQVGLPSRQLLIDSLPPLGIVGHISGSDTILLISHACLDGGERIEHVALHHDELRDSVHHNGISKCHEVDPSTSAVAPGYGTVLMPNLTDAVARLVEKFDGERPGSHTCRISFEDTEHLAYG